MPLATLNDYCLLQGISEQPSSADQGQINTALEAASTAAERYCNRTFAEETTTEYYDGNGYPNLPLKRFPVSDDPADAPTVYLDINGGYGQTSGAFSPSTLLTQGTEYVVLYDRGELQTRQIPGWWPTFGGPVASPWGWPGLSRRGTAWVGWPNVPGCIKVTYTAGYDPIPSDLKAAVVTMSQYMISVAAWGGMVPTSGSYIDVSTGVGFLTEHLARGDVPALGSARGILDSYRDVVVARGPF